MSADTKAQDQPVESSSATAILQQPLGKNIIKYVVSVFGSIGVGIGLTGLLAASLISSGFGFAATIVAAGSLVVSFFAGSIVATMLALNGTFDIGRSTTETYVVSFASTAVGYIIMVLLTMILTSLTADINIGSYISGALFLSIPTGFTTVLIIWIHRSTSLQPTSV